MTMFSDLRVGARQLARRPGLAAAAVLSLGLGIGANTAIFSVLHHVVLEPLPFADPGRLVMVWETQAANRERWVAPANFVDWREQTRAFSAMAAFDAFRPTMSGLGEPEVVRALGVSGNYFATLGASAARGRTQVAADDQADSPPVAVISDGLWQRAFGASADAVGRTLHFDGQAYTVVGVMPRGFPSPLQDEPIDVWLSGERGIPRTFPFSGDLAAVRDSHVLYVVARLADGVSIADAQNEMDASMQQLAERYPDTNAELGAHVQPLHEAVVGDVRGLVTMLQVAVGLVLLIACANVAHLLLAMASERRGEVATRLALGASRQRIVGQLLVETLLIAVPGGILGLVLSRWGLDGLVAAAPRGLPRLGEIAIDPAVLAFTSALTLLTALAFGLGPALALTHGHRMSPPDAATRVVGARATRRWQQGLAIGELALAQVLLLGAGLLLASFMAAQRVALGYETRGRAAADLNLAEEPYLRPAPDGAGIDTAAKEQFVAAVLARLAAAPGVHGAAASFTAPLGGAPNRGVVIEGRAPLTRSVPDTADFQVVTPGFFRTIGATLVRGRAFDDRDTAASVPVAIVNQRFADLYYRGADPIGQRFGFGRGSQHEIVGIVSDMRDRSIEHDAEPTFYVPMTQNREGWRFLSFTVHADGDRSAEMLRGAIREADPDQAIIRVRSYEDIVAQALAGRTFNTVLIAAFAAVAVMLAAVGTYGVIAFAVSSRTRELGVRAAFGATPRDLFGLMLRQGAIITGAAVAIGVGAGLAGASLLSRMLYGVTPRDPGTVVTVAALLSAIALIATCLPARRAVSLDPAQALRNR